MYTVESDIGFWLAKTFWHFWEVWLSERTKNEFVNNHWKWDIRSTVNSMYTTSGLKLGSHSSSFSPISELNKINIYFKMLYWQLVRDQVLLIIHRRCSSQKIPVLGFFLNMPSSQGDVSSFEQVVWKTEPEIWVDFMLLICLLSHVER